MQSDPTTPCWGSVPLPHGDPATPAAREWLAGRLGCQPGAIVLERTGHGRPTLQFPAGHDCNWSHSGGLLAIALGQGLRVGIDIERERPRPNALQLARRFFTRREADWLAGRDDPVRTRDFLRLWCAKEAVLKAHGRGLAFGLDRLEFDEDAGRLRLAGCDPALGPPDSWQLRELQPAPGYHGALAWRAAAPVASRHTAPR